MADILTERGLSASSPRLLFERAGYAMGGPMRRWELSRDSRRFLVIGLERVESSPVTELALVQDMFEELKAKVPAGAAK